MRGMSEAFPESYKEWMREEKGRVEELFPGIFRERKKDLDILSKNVWKAVRWRSYWEVGKEEMEYLTRMPPRPTSIYKTTLELRPLVRKSGKEYTGETCINEERAFEKLRSLMGKLERREVLNADEVASLMRIEEFARSKGREELLREVEKAFTKLGELTKNIAIAAGKMKETELRKGEIKEIDEDILIRRRKDGEVELIILRRKWEGR